MSKGLTAEGRPGKTRSLTQHPSHRTYIPLHTFQLQLFHTLGFGYIVEFGTSHKDIAPVGEHLGPRLIPAFRDPPFTLDD